MFVFRKIWRTLLSCYLRFGIRPFALLPTSYAMYFLILHKKHWWTDSKWANDINNTP